MFSSMPCWPQIKDRKGGQAKRYMQQLVQFVLFSDFPHLEQTQNSCLIANKHNNSMEVIHTYIWLA